MSSFSFGAQIIMDNMEYRLNQYDLFHISVWRCGVCVQGVPISYTLRDHAFRTKLHPCVTIHSPIAFLFTFDYEALLLNISKFTSQETPWVEIDNNHKAMLWFFMLDLTLSKPRLPQDFQQKQRILTRTIRGNINTWQITHISYPRKRWSAIWMWLIFLTLPVKLCVDGVQI